jgi:thiamine-phosphate pyrophosphorylase
LGRASALIRLDPFYPILPDTEWLARLLPLGVKLVQLRVKDRPRNVVSAEIETAIALCAAHRCQLVVNDYWREAIDRGADFVHLGQEDLAGADLTAIRSAGLKIGVSTHSHAELDAALAADADYVALGPIYETKLKAMKWAPQGLARLAEWRARIDRPLVAIGGITRDRAGSVLSAGADSAAVVTDIVTSEDPDLTVKNWIATTAPWRNQSTGHAQD